MVAERAEVENPYRRSLLKQERSRQTRRRLVRAATVLWSTHGYEDTTIEELCLEAGVKRATFYLHFETKERLLQELAWATTERLSADLECRDVGKFEDEITAFIDGLARRMQAIPKALAALVLDRVSGGTPPPELPPDRVIFDDILATIVRRAQERGDARPDHRANDIGAVLGGLTMDTLKRWSHTDDAGLRELLRLRFDIVLDGIRM